MRVYLWKTNLNSIKGAQRVFKETNFEPIIGLEIHAQVKSQSKMFSDEPTAFGQNNNSNVSIVSLGMPGALPVVNEEVVSLAILAGLALNCKVNLHSEFSRKHYFYPDLPKGYQISQFEPPLLEKGFVKIEGRKINIRRIHIEEDAGQSYHRDAQTLVNFNRSGVPLIEIVSEPELRSASEAADYVRKIRQILKYIDVCDGNLQEGSLRCDCNVSLRPKGSEKFGTRVEVKNVNSFKFIEKAINYEIERQTCLLNKKESFHQQTRNFNVKTGETVLIRDKEESKDYRYMPEPDLSVLNLDQERVQKIQSQLCELPEAKQQRFIKTYDLNDYDAESLCREKHLAEYFEEVTQICNKPKSVANWIMGDVSKVLNQDKKKIPDLQFSPQNLAELISLMDEGKISSKGAKIVFEKMCSATDNKLSPKKIVENIGLFVITGEEAILKIVDQVILDHSQQYEAYKSGKDRLFGFFVGKAMQASDGCADPKVLNEVLKKRLNSK